MPDYLFVLGRVRDLCRAEAETILQKEGISSKKFSSSEVLHIVTEKILDPGKLIKILGGTIKIAEVFKKVDDKERIPDEIYNCLKDNADEEAKITFGLSAYGDISVNGLAALCEKIKIKLVSSGFKSRFVLPADDTELSSVVVRKQKVQEFIIVSEANEFILGKTVAIQDFEDWGKRDFQRPASSPHLGMLPPKVSRIMVNLSGSSPNDSLLDPFCGVGTILSEAMIMGLKVCGSDLSQDAINKTKMNLEWLKENYKLQIADYKLLNTDATHISEKISPESIDVIVTEPYLGPFAEHGNLDLRNKKIENVILGLDKLYIGCLREWLKILKNGGRIVIALPALKFQGREYFVKRAIDTCENLGYNLEAGPYAYSRQQAIVIRNIYILKKKIKGD